MAERESATYLIVNTDIIVYFILKMNLYRKIYRQRLLLRTLFVQLRYE